MVKIYTSNEYICITGPHEEIIIAFEIALSKSLWWFFILIDIWFLFFLSSLLLRIPDPTFTFLVWKFVTQWCFVLVMVKIYEIVCLENKDKNVQWYYNNVLDLSFLMWTIDAGYTFIKNVLFSSSNFNFITASTPVVK